MNWKGKWIWAEEYRETPNFYMYARREIQIPDIVNAKLFVTCSTEYKLYINGKYVGRGPNPCHPKYQYFDEYEITRYIRPGKNAIGAICYNYGVGTHCRPEAPGGFLLQIELEERDGNKIIAGTDESWRISPAFEWDFNSTRMFWTIGFQEVYDSRKKPTGWNVVGFDDEDWSEPSFVAEVGIEPWINLVPRQIPHLREVERCPVDVLTYGSVTRIDDSGLDIATRMYKEQVQFDPDALKYPKSLLNRFSDLTIVNPPTDRFIVLDFGKEVVGFPTIRIRDGGCGIIDFGYSEALDINGRVNPTRQDILQADRLILHGGRQEWQTFGRRAFRYMQLTFRDLECPLYIESITIDQVGYPVEQVSTFSCSDELLNKIWETGVYTLSIGMQDAFEDCPLREHGQYPGDVRVQALLNYYSFGDTKLVAKALWQFVQCQREDGLFNALWPSSTNHILPDYNLVWVMILYDYYLYTGDADLVRKLYPNMRLLLENWVRTQESENGLLTWEADDSVPMHEWWLFIDHMPLDKRGEVAAYNAFYYQALRDASKLARALSELDDAVMWHNRADEVAKAFNRRFWSEEKGAYVDCYASDGPSNIVSVQTNYLAILFGLSNNEQNEKIVAYMKSDKPRIESSGPYFNFYVLQALAKLDMTQEALDLIRRDWGLMLDHGATTWWETLEIGPDGVCPHSLCHPWSGAPTYFLPAEILGVKPAKPESSIFVIQPRPGDLQWAKGSIKFSRGKVDVEWHNEPGKFQIEINSPDRFIVALPVSSFKNPEIKEIDMTPETPVRKARKSFGWGNVIWRDGEERDPYLDWLSSQEEKPPENYKQVKRGSIEGKYIWIRESPSNHVKYEIIEGE